MPHKDTVVILGLCVASLCGFIGVGIWSTADSVATAPLSAQDDPALDALEKSAQSPSGTASTFKQLGAAYIASGRLREAVSAYISASALAPGDPEIQRALITLQAMAEARGQH